MKKILILLGLVVFSVPAFAGGVGYVNYEKVVANYQYAKNTMRELETKGNEIQRYLEAKEKEFSTIESAVQKKKFEDTVRSELLTKEKAFNAFRDKKEEEVYTRIHSVTEKIRMEKGLDAVLDSRSVFSGGVDITDLLIQRLNAGGGK